MGVAHEISNVGVIEDDQRQREALAFQLSTAGFRVSSYSSAESFLESAKLDDFDCLVSDICLPKMNGLQLLVVIKELAPFLAVIFITGYGDMSTGVQAMREGALDCVEKPIDDSTLINSIARGVESSRAQRSEHMRRLELERRQASLTPRERQTFALITAGLLNKQVGGQLGPSEGTIKKHRGRVMKKMGADSLAELVRMSEILRIHSAAKPQAQ